MPAFSFWGIDYFRGTSEYISGKGNGRMNKVTDEKAAELVAEALAHLQIAGNVLEQAFLMAGVDSPWFDLALRVDAVVRDAQAHKV